MKMHKKFMDMMEYMTVSLVELLILLVLLRTSAAHNAVEQSRPEGECREIENVVCEQMQKADTPAGIVKEYRFTLDKTSHADTLSFYINHHNVEVYVEEECIYRVTEQGDIFHTTGGVYAMIPLYEQDAGKEVRVILTPLYDNYQDEPEFVIGSELAIYQVALRQAVPELILCLCAVLVGVVLLSFAVYQSIRQYPALQMYGIGILAVSAGVWRFTYGRFAYLVLEGHSVFIYTLSVISLMVMTVAMLGCVKVPENNRKAKSVIRYAMLVYGVVDIVQLFLQFVGILDLRQTLWMTHTMVVFSAAVVLWGGIGLWLTQGTDSGRIFGRNYSWLLGIGAMIDLLLYYFAEDLFGLLFILGAILCFSMLEGIRLLMNFSRQKNELEEMQTQLTLSRTATMMSQIRSHFVFNLLNAISGMCKYDPEKADDTVVRFARYLRNNIDIMQEDKNIPFATDLRQLEDYVALEQVRFGDKIEFYADAETMDFMIPPLILQPVVENAIKHGISKKTGNGTIILRTRKQGETVVITVEDDGIGFDMAELDKEKSIGLKNIRFRLEHLVNGTFAISSEVNKGTVVTITIPKQDEKNTNKNKGMRKQT